MKHVFLKRVLTVLLGVSMFCTVFAGLSSAGVAHAAALPTKGHSASVGQIVSNGTPGGANQIPVSWYEGQCNAADFVFHTSTGVGHQFCVYLSQTNSWGILNFSPTQPNTFSVYTGYYGGGWFEYNNGTYVSFGDNQVIHLNFVTLDAVFLNGCADFAPC